MNIKEQLKNEFFKALDEDSFHELFSLERFNAVSVPFPVQRFYLDKPFGSYRCLHLLIRQGDSSVLLPDELESYEILYDMINVTDRYEEFVGHYPYLYLTIDTLPVVEGSTQRTPGWHVDCVQGDEVPVKKPSNLTFSWSNTVPMEYVEQPFKLPDYVSVSTHNIFECLAALVNPKNIRQCEEQMLYCINTYCVHRSAVATEDTHRTFIRLSYTHVPITNVLMTVNPKIEYDYPVHSTAGKIPKHLKTTLE